MDQLSNKIQGITHHRAALNGTELHYVSAGDTGSPVLLVHGFPETWWAFHDVISVLAKSHRVFAVDLRGFGDSGNGSGEYGSKVSAEDLHLLIEHVGFGAVHLTGQDISGATVLRLAIAHPEDVLSFTAIEMGLPGYGLEAFADVTHGGAWYIGVLAAPGIPEMLLAGREREFMGNLIFSAMTANPEAITGADIEEFARTYSRPDGWRGSIGLYKAMLEEGPEIKAMVEMQRLTMPVLAIDGGGGLFTLNTMSQVASTEVRSILLEGVGHYAAMEAPARVAEAILSFLKEVDKTIALSPKVDIPTQIDLRVASGHEEHED